MTVEKLVDDVEDVMGADVMWSAPRADVDPAARGSALPLVVGILGVCLVVMVVVVEVGRAAAARAQAQATADMAALAGVFEGERGARELSAANGGVLVAFSDRDGTVSVTVRSGSARAVARARYDWEATGS